MAKQKSKVGKAKFFVSKKNRSILKNVLEKREITLLMPKSGDNTSNVPRLFVYPPISSEENALFRSSMRGATKKKPKNKKDIFEVRDKGSEKERYLVSRTYKSCAVFSSTSKMGCSSWSIPAGHPMLEGSCPTAVQVGLRRVDPAEYKKLRANVEKQVGEPLDQSGTIKDPVTSFICDYCYAGKGNYGNTSTQLYQMVRKVWQDRVIKEHGIGGFAALMVQAIAANAENLKSRYGRLSSEKKHPGFFRVHDSGDFASVKILDAWIEITKQLPKINFWAPTRIWMLPAFKRRFSSVPANFSIRPSALHAGDESPDIHGLAGGSSVKKTESTNTGKAQAKLQGEWDCPAYRAVDDDGKSDKSCQQAINPLGTKHCRVCWGVAPTAGALKKRPDFKQTPVNYQPH